MLRAACRLSNDGRLDIALEDAACWQDLDQLISGFDRSMQRLLATLRKPGGDTLLEGIMAHLSLNQYYI